MTAAEVLANGRELAEELMVDTCTIRRATGPRVFDRETGTYAPAPSAVRYSGRCQVQIGGNADSLTPDVGAATPTVQQLTVKVPVTTEPFKIGDEVTIDSAVHDTTLAGRRYTVTGLHAKTFATARRLQCEEITDA